MFFSKALFKQSMKAHWVKWLMVTLSTCIMLAIIIVVLGNLGINNIRDSLKEVFVQADQESFLKENAVDCYDLYLSTVEMKHTLENMPSQQVQQAYGMLTLAINQGIENYKNQNGGAEPDDAAMDAIILETSTTLKDTIKQFPIEGFEMLQELPDEMLVDFFVSYYNSYFASNISITDPQFVTQYKDLLLDAFLDFVGKTTYKKYMSHEDSTIEVAEYSAEEMVALAENAIASYSPTEGEIDLAPYKPAALSGVNELMKNVAYQRQISQGYSSSIANQYAAVAKVTSNTAISTYEMYLTEYAQYDDAKTRAKDKACKSIFDQIPEKVEIALSELGNMDIYGMIIGSIFYRIAGLLMPMVFVIMTANSLLAGQVDSGSMAYVLSTPTKRRTVTVTQMTYLVLALFAMFSILTITSVIAIWICGGNSFAINYGQILLFNLGAFLTMFAFAGFCFMCSAIFNRTKYSLGIGGGLTIFSLVCTILGLFGSTVIPSAMRISAMNFFNYLSLITLYDTVSIMAGTTAYLWKFAILLGVGIVTFIIGIFRFDKKDLPL